MLIRNELKIGIVKIKGGGGPGQVAVKPWP
jgi:hypothetical protein